MAFNLKIKKSVEKSNAVDKNDFKRDHFLQNLSYKIAVNNQSSFVYLARQSISNEAKSLTKWHFAEKQLGFKRF